MDFLNIRKKAKERARARAAGEGEASAPKPSPASPPAAPATPPPDAPVVTDEDVLEGALAARLQGLPEAELPFPPDAEPDARFTTWRPGTGAPPVLAEPEPAAAVAPGRPEDFAVVVRAQAAPEGLPAPEHPAPEPAELPPAAPWSAAAPPVAVPAASADPLDEFFFREDEAGPALPDIAPAVEADVAPAVLAREEFLTFLLGAEEYAVAIERVREVVRAPPVTEVPRAPAHILGVVTVRGEVVAVVDPRRRLGLPHPAPAEGQGKIVIVDAGDGPCGIHVDRVASVVRLRPGSIEPCPQGIAGQRAEYLAGIGREGDRLFTVLDLGALLRRAAPRADGTRGRADA
jgi:purine-binding chemotaxis protein CheW